NTDGSLDNTFGNGGIVTTDIDSGGDWIWEMAFHLEGKIIIAGRSGMVNIGTGHNFAMAQYNPDGSLDPFFGNNGIVTTDLGFDNEDAYGMGIQADGKIILGGFSGNISDNIYQFTLLRYKANGS